MITRSDIAFQAFVLLKEKLDGIQCIIVKDTDNAITLRSEVLAERKDLMMLSIQDFTEKFIVPAVEDLYEKIKATMHGTTLSCCPCEAEGGPGNNDFGSFIVAGDISIMYSRILVPAVDCGDRILSSISVRVLEL